MRAFFCDLPLHPIMDSLINLCDLPLHPIFFFVRFTCNGVASCM